MAQQPQNDTELSVMKAELRTDIHAVGKSVHKVAEDQIGIANQIDTLKILMIAKFARVDGDIDAFKTEFVAFKTEMIERFEQVEGDVAAVKIDLAAVKGDVAALKAALVLIAEALGIGDAVRQLLTEQ